MSELVNLLLSGLALGLSLGPFCAISCGPLLGISVAGELGRGGRAWWASTRFLLGRFIAYAAVGAAAGGLLGERLARLPAREVGIGVTGCTLALGLLLVLFGALAWRRGAQGDGAHHGLLCFGSRFARLAGAPFIFGLLAGISPCPQFLLAAVGATASSSWLGGLLHFTGLYAGSSVFVIPALLVRARSPRTRALAARVGSSAAILVGIFYALAGIRGLSVQLEPPAPLGVARISEKRARELLPDAEYFRIEGPSLLAGYRRRMGREEPTGFVARGVGEGHCSGLELLLGVTAGRDRILRARIGTNGETPEYMETFRSGKLLAALAGKSTGDAFEIGKDLDAVSSATRTSEGVAMAARAAARVVTGAKTPQGSASLLTRPDWKSIAAAAYLLLVAILLPRLRGRVRFACMLVSAAAMGSLLGRFFSVTDFSQACTGLLPGGAAGAGLLLFLVVLTAVTLWRGRVWCSHVCPFGCLTELGGRLTRARARTPRALARIARFLPWATLAAVGATIAWTGKTGAAAAEPFGLAAQLLGSPRAALKQVLASPLPVAFFAAVLLTSLVSMRFYCRHLCGAGALLKTLARAGTKGAGGSAGGSESKTREPQEAVPAADGAPDDGEG